MIKFFKRLKFKLFDKRCSYCIYGGLHICNDMNTVDGRLHVAEFRLRYILDILDGKTAFYSEDTEEVRKLARTYFESKILT